MTFEITPYVIICAFTAIIAAIVAFVAWQRRKIPGGTSLALLMAAVTWWSASFAFEYATVGVSGKVFWSKIEYVGALSCPVLYLLLALEYNRMNHWLTKRNIALLFIVPLITLGLAVTNEWHGLIWSGFSPSPVGRNLLIYEHGVGYWIGTVGYSYLVMLIGTVLLVWAAVRFPVLYRRQTGALIVGAIAPWAGNLIYVAGLSPVPGLELTPLVLAFSGVVLAWGLFRFRLLTLVPVARDTLIETMTDGMLVLDDQNQVVDFNPAAQHLLRTLAKIELGQDVEEVFSAIPEWEADLKDTRGTSIEIALTDEEHKYLEFTISPVSDRRNRYTGRLIIMRDVTERRRAEEGIQRANERLRAQLAEIEILQANLRDQAIRDSLTGLFNRRYLDETLERELARAAREQVPVSAVMMDIDHFKAFNDMYGHEAGDDVLQALGQLLRAQTRTGDIACRYGGEEFVIIMPGTSCAVAIRRAEQWRVAFESISIAHQGQLLHTTFSGGVATFPDHGATADEVMRAADLALYASKASGRNCISTVP
jgi:diguanylate cyclase (GGDEF)-like protein/PAS domain S-box-containing protein